MNQPLRLLALLLLVLSCNPAPQAAPDERTDAEALQRMAQTLRRFAESQVYVQLDGRDLLLIRGAIGRHQGVPLTFTFANPAPAEQPDAPPCDDDATGQVHTLVPSHPSFPTIQCEIVATTEPDGVEVILYSDYELPEITLLATTRVPMLPVRLHAPAVDRVLQSAMGPGGTGTLDGLYDAFRDWAIEIRGNVRYQPAEDGVTVLASLPRYTAGREPILKLISHRRFVKNRFDVDWSQPLDPWQAQPAPALYDGCPEASPEIAPAELERTIRWLGTHLTPFGLETARLPGKLAELRATARQAGFTTVEPCPSPAPATTPATSTTPPSPPSATPDSAINIGTVWQGDEMIDRLLANYWSHGILGYADPGPLRPGDSMAPAPMRRWASMLALTGSPLRLAGALDKLTADQRAIVRKILPPAPIRAVDLFAHHRPALWNLKVANVYQRYDVLGIMNWQNAARTHKIWLDRLALPINEGRRYLILDRWSDRMLTVTGDHFTVHLPAGDTRVVAIVPLNQETPTVIGTDRHLVDLAHGLHEVRYAPQQRTLAGRVDVMANCPSTIRIANPTVGPGMNVASVQTSQGDYQLGRDGLLHTLTLRDGDSASIAWRITFEPTTPSTESAPQSAPASSDN